IGKVKIIAFDEEDETLAGVKEGAIYATVVQQPFEFGYQSMIFLSKAIGGDKSWIPPTKQKIVDTLAIKKDSVEEFTVKINKLRGRS
ncbi:MAG TPA: ABC transporter substrate-binding protein, partial [Blastocatellia bacterium]|nr:ABC transporter substrate-binding protein [Blastocatellia bacterium]